MRIFILLGVFLFSPVGVLAQALPVPSGLSPCGTETRPAKVMAPVTLNVQQVTGAQQYVWLVKNNRTGQEFSQPLPATQSAWFTYSDLSPLPVIMGDLYKWRVYARRSLNSDVDASGWSDPECFIQITKICPAGAVCLQNPLQAENFTDIINTILNFIFNIAIVVAPIMVIAAGFLFVTGGASPAQITKARTILLWTAVGFGVILISRGLIAVLRKIIGF